MTLTPSDAHRIGLEAAALGAKATPGPWCIDSVGEKQNEYVVGVAFAATDEDCESPLSGWLPPLAEDESEHPYCDEKVCELDNAANADLIAHAGTHYASLGSWAARWAKVVEAAEAWLTARTALEAADRANSYKDEIEVFECAEKTLADEVGKARNQSK